HASFLVPLTTTSYTLSLHDALPIWHRSCFACSYDGCGISFNKHVQCYALDNFPYCHHHYHLLNNTLCEACSLGIEGECIENELRSEEYTSELQSRFDLVCRLLLEKK